MNQVIFAVKNCMILTNILFIFEYSESSTWKKFKLNN